MTEHERTGHRPSGFSVWQRTLIAEGRELRNVTRHIDGDWCWVCAGCHDTVVLIEDKFRPDSPPARVVTSECAFMRRLAGQAGIAALAIAWTNDARNSDRPPDEFVARLWLAGRERALADMDVERILVKLFRAHWDDCPRRPF